MIELRKCEKEDWDSIIELHKLNKIDFPDFKNMLSAAVIVEDNKVIAFGCIKKFVEATFIPSGIRKEIAISLRLLSEQMIKDSQELELDFIHVFSENKTFIQVLKSHFNYTDCKGAAVQLEIPYEQ